MTRFVVNVVGYIDDNNNERTHDTIAAMLNRQAITECFKPLNVVEIIVQSMKKEHSIYKGKVSKTKLSMA